MIPRTIVAAALLSFVALARAEEPFTIAVIPDTQIMSLNDVWGEAFRDQTTWLRQHAAAENIVFVSHVGDIVQGSVEGVEQLPGSTWQDQWARTDAIMAELDRANTVDGRVLPYSASLGNHDLLPQGDKANADDTMPGGGFVSHFGADRYGSYGWYGGSDATQWNHYQTFEANGQSYLHINLEYRPDDPTTDVNAGLNRTAGIDDAINWAQSVIDAHPDVPTIVSSHMLLTDLEPDDSDLDGFAGDGVDETFGGKRTNTGQAVWERLVDPNPQVFMTLNGHEHEGPYREDGEYHQVTENSAGLPVYEILVNYQDYVNPLTGNDPYLRLIEFDPAAGEIRHRTFNPTFDLFHNDPSAVEDRLDAILDQFEAPFGFPVPIYDGEDLAGALVSDPALASLLGLPAASRAEAEAAIFDFFGVSDLEGLGAVDFSPHLTDPDSAFTLDVRFDASGRPVPEPATLVLAAAGAGLMLPRRRR